MFEFKPLAIGEQVVCIDAKGHDTRDEFHSGLREGNVYVIQGISDCHECGIRFLDVGLRHNIELPHTSCRSCGTTHYTAPFIHFAYAYRFRRMDGVFEQKMVQKAVEVQNV